MTKYVCTVVLGLVTFAGCGATSSAPDPVPDPVPPPAREEIGYRVRLRWTILKPADRMITLHALIERNNQKEQRAEIDPTLNAKLIDPAKVDAFLAALDHLPSETRFAVSGGTILLDDEMLYLDVASPAVPENFATLTGFSKFELAGENLVLVPRMQVDVVRAREQVDRSVAAIAAINERLASADPGDPGALMRTRFQLAWVWRANLTALANAATAANRTALTTELAVATKVISGYVVNMGSMPDDDDLPTAPRTHIPQGDPCPSDTCVAPAQCIQLSRMDLGSGRNQCWISCAADATVCPGTSQCVMVHDGPGKVCVSPDPD